jgi:hypothetical protein
MPEGRQCSFGNSDDFVRNADERSQTQTAVETQKACLSTYLDIRFIDIGRLEYVSRCSACGRILGWERGQLTKPLTMILLSPDAVDGPVGITLVAGLACLVAFLTPPTGAVVVAPWALEDFWSRRRLPLRAFWRRLLRISSRDLSSLADMMMLAPEKRREFAGIGDREV